MKCVNTAGTTLHEAASSGDIKYVRALIAKGVDVKAVNAYHKTALHLAAMGGHIECVEDLLAAGADVTATDQRVNTALHYATKVGSAQCVKALLKAGANVTALDKAGRTALHYAAKAGNAQCAKLLLDKGVETGLKDEDGKTALICALDCNLPVFAYLLSHSKYPLSDKAMRETQNQLEEALSYARKNNFLDKAIRVAKQGGGTEEITIKEALERQLRWLPRRPLEILRGQRQAARDHVNGGRHVAALEAERAIEAATNTLNKNLVTPAA